LEAMRICVVPKNRRRLREVNVDAFAKPFQDELAAVNLRILHEHTIRRVTPVGSPGVIFSSRENGLICAAVSGRRELRKVAAAQCLARAKLS